MKNIQRFLDRIYVNSHSNETVKTYNNSIKKFCKFLDSRYNLELDGLISKLQEKELDVFDMFNEFVVFMDKEGLKPRSIHLKTSAIKSFLRFSGIKIYNEDFKQSVRLPKKYRIQEVPLTKDIILRLLRNVSPKLQAVILVHVCLFYLVRNSYSNYQCKEQPKCNSKDNADFL